MISSTCFKGGLYDKGAPYTSSVSNWMCTIGISPNHVFWPNSGLTLRPWCWNRGWQAWQQRDGSNFWVIKCLPNSSWAEIHCWYAIIEGMRRPGSSGTKVGWWLRFLMHVENEGKDEWKVVVTCRWNVICACPPIVGLYSDEAGGTFFFETAPF